MTIRDCLHRAALAAFATAILAGPAAADLPPPDLLPALPPATTPAPAPVIPVSDQKPITPPSIPAPAATPTLPPLPAVDVKAPVLPLSTVDAKAPAIPALPKLPDVKPVDGKPAEPVVPAVNLPDIKMPDVKPVATKPTAAKPLAPLPTATATLPPMISPAPTAAPPTLTPPPSVTPSPVVVTPPKSVAPAPVVPSVAPPVVLTSSSSAKPSEVVPAPKSIELPKVELPKVEAPMSVVPPATAPAPITVVPPARKSEVPVIAVSQVKSTPEAAPPISPMSPASPPTSEPARPTVASVTLGKSAVDSVAAYGMMLAEARIQMNKIVDYSGHMVHEERIRGKMTAPMKAEIRAKAKPNSLALRYVAPNTMLGLEMAYVSGKFGGKVRMKPAGAYGPSAFLSVDATDPRAMSHTRHLLYEFGIASMLDLLERQMAVEQRLKNAVSVQVSDVPYGYAGRQTTRVEVYFDRPHSLRYAAKMVVYFDVETKLPIRMEAYDTPPVGGTADSNLIETVSYVDLKFNQGLGDDLFVK